jgi:hypothetical protein
MIPEILVKATLTTVRLRYIRLPLLVSTRPKGRLWMVLVLTLKKKSMTEVPNEEVFVTSDPYIRCPLAISLDRAHAPTKI